MPKFFTLAVFTLAALMLLGNSLAQQTPAPAPPASSTKAQHPPAPNSRSKTTPALTTQKDKFSYALGMNLGINLQKQSLPVNADLLARGIRDGLAGGKTLLTEDEARAVMTEMQNQFRQQLGETNKKEGDAFLAANKAKDGVVTLPSGLQYKILQAGTGPKPAATDTVTVNYRGTLINGTEFDSSYKHGKPITFPLNGVIKGWTEALQLMPTGSKWQLFIPSSLAYAERGAGTDIGPSAVLIFEVELLSIKAPEKAADKPEEKK